MIAGLFSHTVYLTADDPGTEPLEKIFDDIRPHVETTGCACICVKDRKEAVFQAVRAVSYTHLDVYKRQSEVSAKKVRTRICF